MENSVRSEKHRLYMRKYRQDPDNRRLQTIYCQQWKEQNRKSRVELNILQRQKAIYHSLYHRHKRRWPDEECITFEQFQQALGPMVCTLTGLKLRWSSELRDDLMPSVDRVDNGHGYSLSNVRLVCYRIQLMRRELPDEQFLHFCRLVTEREVTP